jgi:hypothetical protein
MKHAGDDVFDQLADLLGEIRKQERLKEKKRGVFYLGSAAFLHFHHDPEGLFADLRVGSCWERFPVTNKRQRKTFVSRLKAELGDYR